MKLITHFVLHISFIVVFGIGSIYLSCRILCFQQQQSMNEIPIHSVNLLAVHSNLRLILKLFSLDEAQAHFYCNKNYQYIVGAHAQYFYIYVLLMLKQSERLSTVQHSTAQHSTLQHISQPNTIQRNAIQHTYSLVEVWCCILCFCFRFVSFRSVAYERDGTVYASV